MYAMLHYTGAATNREALSDIIGLITGTITLTSQLSSNTVTENSLIVNTVLPGWELWDDVSATEKIVRAPVSDDPSSYKYLRFIASGSDRVYNQVYRNWDNATHTGTPWPRYVNYSNSTTYDSESVIWYDTNNTDTMTLISSSANHFSSCVRHNNIASNGPVTIVSEYERTAEWDTIEDGFIPMVYNSNPINVSSFTLDQCSSSTSYRWYPFWFIKPQVVLGNTKYDIATTRNNHQYCRCYPTTALGGFGTTWSTNNTKAFNNVFKPVDQIYDSPGGTTTYQLFPFGAAGIGTSPSNTWVCTDNISSKCGIFLSSMDSSSGLGFGDQVIINGQNYRIWNPAGAGQKFLLVAEK